jgi:hypothetical protein
MKPPPVVINTLISLIRACVIDRDASMMAQSSHFMVGSLK